MNFNFDLILSGSVNGKTVLAAFLIMLGVSVAFAVLILVIAKLFAVKQDEKLKAILENLAGSDCGGCGFAGCQGCAKALLEGKANLDVCTQTSAKGKANIAEILGVEYGAAEEQVAVVACNGGENCNDKYNYLGYGDCVSREFMMGGSKMCEFGCLGSGTCEKACPFEAIGYKDGVAKIDPSLCTSCGKCTTVCPKHIIKRIPKKSKYYIACSSSCRGKDVLTACKNGCIGCGLCAKNCPKQAITMVDNLPVIDYSKCISCGLCFEKCPRKCIHEVHSFPIKPNKESK